LAEGRDFTCARDDGSTVARKRQDTQMGEVPQATVEAGGVFKCSVVGEDRDGSMSDLSQEEIDRLDRETGMVRKTSDQIHMTLQTTSHVTSSRPLPNLPFTFSWPT